METFLHEVAQRILKENPTAMDQVLVVFNNRRPGLFLRRELTSLADNSKAFFLPKMVGMDELVSEMSSLKIIPKEFLLFELYDIHRQICTDDHKDETFEDFISFGDMMLNDFAEIDLYRVDAKSLFSNIHDLKSIGEWNVEEPTLNEFQKRYLQFYQSLFVYYTQLHDKLLAENKAYSGMAYRSVADNIDNLIDKIRYKRIYFVGFSVLSKCERVIIDKCVKRGIGQVIVDGDDYYVNDSSQEAGRFIRELKDLTPQDTLYPAHLKKEEKCIHLVNCPENLMQTKYAGNLLSQMFSEQKQTTELDTAVRSNTIGTLSDKDKYHGTSVLENTCLVLADESLLLPMLNSLPEQVNKANITMGLPFTYSAIHTLLLRLLQLYKTARGTKFYQRDLLSLLSDYNIGLLLGDNDLYSKVLNYLATNTLVYLDTEQITLLCRKIGVKEDLIHFLFALPDTERTNSKEDNIIAIDNRQTTLPVDNGAESSAQASDSKNYDSHESKKNDNTLPSPYADPSLFLSNCKELIARLSQVDSINENIEEHEALACGYEIINYLDQLQHKYRYITTLNTMEKIYSRLAQRHNIAFYGEPLEGLQILGVLETRCLDFDRVIILSVNESILPSGKSNNTLIPFSLKRANGMPTYTERDAVYAYHFYRILQRAKDITLVYHTETGSLSKGEPSRFIAQITSELIPAGDSIHLDKKTISINGKVTPKNSIISATKSEDIMKQLTAQAERGFSPTALNTYHLCPMRFYRTYVLHIQEEIDVAEDIESSELGTIIHDILKYIYTLDTDKKIKISTLKEQLDNVDKLVDDTFATTYQKGRTLEGRNFYSLSIAKTQISELLKKELALLKNGDTIQLVDCEKDFKETLPLNLPSGTTSVNIFGRADRIDRFNNQLRVIDYKTGRVETKKLIYDDKSKDYSDKWFQVMTYAWLYMQKHPDESIQSGIYPLGDLKSEFTPVRWGDNTIFDSQHILKFQTMLQDLLCELMDRNIPFAATPQTDACNYCLFANICSVSKQSMK